MKTFCSLVLWNQLEFKPTNPMKAVSPPMMEELEKESLFAPWEPSLEFPSRKIEMNGSEKLDSSKRIATKT